MRWRRNSTKPWQELEELALFRGLPAPVLERAHNLYTEISVPAGRVLTVEGRPARQAFVIREGTVEVSSATGDLDTRCDGELIGEMALVYGMPRCATTTALTDTRLMVFTPCEFHALLAEPTVRDRVLEVADSRLQDSVVRRPKWLESAAGLASIGERADQPTFAF